MAIFNSVYKSFEQGGGGWQPGANTLAYRPLVEDATDALGNYDGTITGTALTFGTVGGSTKNSAFFSATRMTTSFSTTPTTINFWAYKPSSSSDPSVNDWKTPITNRLGNNTSGFGIRFAEMNNANCFYVLKTGSSSVDYRSGVKTTDEWINICITTDGTNTYVYENSQLIMTKSGGLGTPDGTLTLGTSPRDTLGNNYDWRGYISAVIVEDVNWTAQDVSDYFDLTKGDYGIS